MLVRPIRVDAFPSAFAGRLLDQDPVTPQRLLTRGTPLSCRVVPRPSAALFPLLPLEYPSQPPEHLLPLRHEMGRIRASCASAAHGRSCVWLPIPPFEFPPRVLRPLMEDLEFTPHVLPPLMEDLEFGCQNPHTSCAIEDFVEIHL